MKRLIVAAATAAVLAGSAEAAAPKAHAVEGAASGWAYSESKLDTGVRVRTYCTLSKNLATLSFPYKPTRVKLCVSYYGEPDRKNPSTSVELKLVGKGQFTGDTAWLTFDNGAELLAQGFAADDSNMIYDLEENSAAKVIRPMLKSKVMKAKVSFFEDGRQELEFDISGLKFPHAGLTQEERLARKEQIEAANGDAARIAAIDAKYDCIAEDRTDCPK